MEDIRNHSIATIKYMLNPLVFDGETTLANDTI